MEFKLASNGKLESYLAGKLKASRGTVAHAPIIIICYSRTDRDKIRALLSGLDPDNLLDVVTVGAYGDSSTLLSSIRDSANADDSARVVPTSQKESGMMRPLRILHISDLHERAPFDGMPPTRGAQIRLDAEERGLILGPEFSRALVEISSGGIDLVCFTGDLADWGHPNEYAIASERIAKILELVKVGKERFFAVPGNHDVRRSVQEEAWQGIRSWHASTHNTPELGRWFRQAGHAPFGLTAEWREKILERTATFWDWLGSFGRPELRPTAPNLLGYRYTFAAGTFLQIDAPVHIVGLDSSWLCGADNDQGRILVTDQQVLAHIRDGEQPLDGFRVALVHHPLDHLADHHSVRRLLAQEGVDLLLHGHQHTPLAIDTAEPGARLRVLAAGCLVEGDLGKDWPNEFHLVEIDVVSKSMDVIFRKWSPGGGFWAKGSDIYRNAPDGTLRWPSGSTPLA